MTRAKCHWVLTMLLAHSLLSLPLLILGEGPRCVKNIYIFRGVWKDGLSWNDTAIPYLRFILLNCVTFSLPQAEMEVHHLGSCISRKPDGSYVSNKLTPWVKRPERQHSPGLKVDQSLRLLRVPSSRSRTQSPRKRSGHTETKTPGQKTECGMTGSLSSSPGFWNCQMAILWLLPLCC